jgi:hypothetical protein
MAKWHPLRRTKTIAWAVGRFLVHAFDQLVEEAPTFAFFGAGVFVGWATSLASQPSVPGVVEPKLWSSWPVSVGALIVAGCGVALWVVRGSRSVKAKALERERSEQENTVTLSDGTVVRARGKIDVTLPGAGGGVAATVSQPADVQLRGSAYGMSGAGAGITVEVGSSTEQDGDDEG